MQNNNFSFWCPLGDINKATDPNTGEEIMLLGGIASTADEDSDGEFLDPKGFDIKPLLNSGLVNWHHQAKTNPGTIVGEPIKAEIRKEGLYIETKLYPHSQTACDIWELAKTLASDSKTRRLGYSIEGRVVKRKSEDPTSPDYKKIIKAIITGVAITHQPKNPKTFANIIKGEIDDISEEDVKEEDVKEKEESVDVEESVNTESAAALKKESVDSNLKITTFSKSEVFDRIFHDIAGISIRKAKQIYSLIEKIADMKREGSAITQEDIEKAYDALGLEAPIDVVKSEDEEDFSEEDETNEDEDSEEEDVKNTEDDETDSDEDSEDEDEDEDEEGEVKKSNFNDIEGMISQSHNSQARYIKAVAVLIKAQSNQLAEANHNLQKAIDTINSQNEIIKGYESQLDDLSEKISQIGSMTPAPKAIRHAAPVERMFKGNTENDFSESRNSGYKRISMSQRSVIADILDKATFAKGFDDEFSKATTSFEAGAPLSANVVKRIKDEYGIEIV